MRKTHGEEIVKLDKKTDKDKNNTGTKRKIQFSRQKKWNRLPPTEPLIVISHKQGNNEKLKISKQNWKDCS